MGKQRKRYTEEFKNDAVKLVLEEGFSKAEAARRLDIGENSLGKWVKGYLKTEDDKGSAGSGLSAAEVKELRRLREENRQLKLEREILKLPQTFYHFPRHN